MIIALRRCRPVRFVNEFTTTARRCEVSDDDGDKKNKQKVAASKLQELLTKLAAESASEKNKTDEKSKFKMAQPVKREVEKRPIYKVKVERITDKHTAKLVAAVKDVADHVGGADVKATEAELLHVILNNKKPDGMSSKDLKLESVISGMQIEKAEDTRAAQVRRNLGADRRPRAVPKRDRLGESAVDLFNHKPLGIFNSDFRSEAPSFQLLTWSKMAERELRLLVTHPSTNIYEEMVRWTDSGKLWTFPIDNEQGLEEEKKIDFTQHVFLDEHLEPWCPQKGPVRYFMELVLVGLSKNPYITVQAKIDHIHWFRDYFESKKKLLQEIGALPDIGGDKELPAS